MSALHVATPDALLDHIGDELGPTEWVEVAQDRIERFA
ncbi:MAG: dehydratase, partial [Mycobacteriaceae bacterium]|nr:dehydratase [Mycobacteriaceae bacterium]